MSFNRKSDVHNHLAASRKHYSLLTVMPPSEPNATDHPATDEDVVTDTATESSFVIGNTPKPHIVLPGSDKENA
ncbi:hypothetical protein [Edaphobacter sp. 12200R-103]|jgi:hypothetical protein|uniref:hypothetical protein n=1 Tax=Edaphobacter sp. 12200R-103 TaxID=2703788 RepID=UPI00138C57BF|nr:hypothetical protein [Edaphobacter sp. 12200R-103]QHS51531.1 hypothetical protein GWR55_07055 [Edaphobacter sp. 12200R-103]